MQETLPTARQTAAAGDRLTAVMRAHQELETDIANFEAARSLALKGHRSFGDFDPWQELYTTVERASADAAVCLRLFNPRRKMESTRAMATAEALYRPAGKNPGDRLVAFADSVAQGFSAQLPLSVALDTARALQKIDARLAHGFISDTLRGCLAFLVEQAAAGCEAEADASVRIRRTVLGAQGAVLRNISMLVGLDAVCCVQAQGQSQGGSGEHVAMVSTLTTQKTALEKLLSASVLEELHAYAGLCQRELPRKQARLQAKEQRQDQAATAQQQQEKAAGTRQAGGAPHAAAQQSSGKESPLAAREDAGPTSPRTFLQILANPLNVDGWKLHLSRMILVSAAILFLRLLATRGINAVKGLSNVLRRSSTHSKRRKLTL